MTVLPLLAITTTMSWRCFPNGFSRIGEPVSTAEKGPAGQQKKSGGSSISSIDLYNSMELGEQERLESLGGNDDEEDSERDSGASLLSMVSGDDSDDVASSGQEHLTTLLTCMSCSGRLPVWQDDQNSHIDEQSYCLSDRGQSLSRDNGNENSNGHEEPNVCSGAVRVSIWFIAILINMICISCYPTQPLWSVVDMTISDITPHRLFLCYCSI